MVLEQDATVNNEVYEFAMLSTTMLGDDYTSVKSAKYGSKRTGKNVWGSGEDPVGGTGGKREPYCEVEILFEAWRKLRAKLWEEAKRTGVSGYGKVRFDLTFTLRKNSQSPEITDVVQGARVLDAPNERSDGDGFWVKLVLEPLKVIEENEMVI